MAGHAVARRAGGAFRTLTALIAAALIVASTADIAYTPGGGIGGTPHDWSGYICTQCHVK